MANARHKRLPVIQLSPDFIVKKSAKKTQVVNQQSLLLIRMKELDREFARQSKQLTKLVQSLKNKLTHL